MYHQPLSIQEWCFKWRKPFTLIEWCLLKSTLSGCRLQTEPVWCQGHSENRAHRTDYSCFKSHWYAHTLRWSVYLQFDAHTHRRRKKKTKKRMHALSQMWTCQTQMNTNQNKACKHKEIQRMKTTERIAQSHLSNKCEDASHTHTLERIHTHTNSRHHLVWTWAISAFVL